MAVHAVPPGPAAATGEALAEAYRRVAERGLSKLPGYNARLAVEAVGFRDWEGHRLGVLIAPWFMNLVLLPGPEDDWSELVRFESTEWKFPADKIIFHPSAMEDAGLHLTASLFTDLRGFPDQDTARAVGQEVLRQLFEGAETAEDAAAAAGTTRLLERPVSRRGLLRLVASAAAEEPNGDA